MIKNLHHVLLCTFFAFITLTNYAQVNVAVDIRTDSYGSETTWTLKQGNNILLSGGSYTDVNGGAVIPTQTESVEEGTPLVFTINDSYDDGICCAYGDGFYSIKINGCEIIRGGQFGATISHNFIAASAKANDLALTSLNIPDVVAQGNLIISGMIKNMGSNNVSSYELNYSINNGSPVTQTKNVNLSVCGNAAFSHTIPFIATPGSFNLRVWISLVNNNVDANPLDNELTQSVSVATQLIPRKPLLESFTSATCPPCANYNSSTFNPFLAANNVNTPNAEALVIKYQLNFPNPGTDPSFNPDANTRRGLYAVSGIPDVFLDGGEFSPANQNTLNVRKSVESYINIDLIATKDENTVNAQATVTSYANLPAGLRLHIAVIENEYNYSGGTTSENNFKYVQRKMLPNGNGTTFFEHI